MSVVILIRPVWKHGPRSLVWLRDFGNLNSLIVGNLDRAYLIDQIYIRGQCFSLARAFILGPERW